MIFTNLTLREKKWLLLFLSLLFSWWVFTASATAEAATVYQVTEQELEQLATNLDKLEQISVTQQQESKRLKDTLTKSAQELQMLKDKLTTSTEQLQKAQTSLEKANQLLAQYANEQKRTKLRIKRQRNAWIGATIIAAIVAACHR